MTLCSEQVSDTAALSFLHVGYTTTSVLNRVVATEILFSAAMRVEW